MTRITCDCKTCEINATKTGASFPLTADVPPAAANRAKNAKNRHTFVHIAHDPSGIGAASRRATGIVAVK